MYKEGVQTMESVINNCRIPLQNLFGFSVQLTRHLVDLVLPPTFCTSHAHSPTHTMNFKLSGTFFTFHGRLAEHLFAGED
jgi:hypothetical protein